MKSFGDLMKQAQKASAAKMAEAYGKLTGGFGLPF